MSALSPTTTGILAHARRRGLLLAGLGAVGFSGKAIIVKLAYRYGVDAVTLIMYRMLFALPLFLSLAWWAGRGKRALTWRDARTVLGLGFCGCYLASFLDFAGLRYISASLERLILYLNPTLVLALGAFLFHKKVTRAQITALAVCHLSGVQRRGSAAAWRPAPDRFGDQRCLPDMHRTVLVAEADRKHSRTGRGAMALCS